MTRVPHLTRSEIAILRGMVDTVRRDRQNTPSRPPLERSYTEGEDHQAPEVYIAKPIEESGIPPLTPGRDGAPDQPGSADCYIYRIIHNGSNVPELRQLNRRPYKVYNLTPSSVGRQWIQTHREKGGRWLAVVAGPPTFPAKLFEKVSYEFEYASGDCAFELLFGAPTLYGSYGWIEMMEDPATGDMIEKPDGRFGRAGECDAARERNWSNANVHVSRNFIVEMHQGLPGDCRSSDEGSSVPGRESSAGGGQSTQFRHIFNLHSPREDCARRYMISDDPQNDFP